MRQKAQLRGEGAARSTVVIRCDRIPSLRELRVYKLTFSLGYALSANVTRASQQLLIASVKQPTRVSGSASQAATADPLRALRCCLQSQEVENA
jgi:hypothetical protein